MSPQKSARQENPAVISAAKAPPPPPTALAVNMASAPSTPAPSDDDPLAALMAPRGAPAGTSRPPTTGPPTNTPMNSGMMMGATPTTKNNSAAIPTFSVFTPGPAATPGKESEKRED